MNSLADKTVRFERAVRRSEEEIHVHLNGLQLKDPHLLDMGWNSFFANHFLELDDPRLVPARVVEESRGIYRVRRAREEYAAKIAGKIRYLAQARKDFPAVGDWVAIAPHDESQSRIECILPRKTKLSRKVAGRELNEQIVAANVDNVFVVSSLNREFNLRRIERYLTLVWDSGAAPVVLLNKTDLCADAAAQARPHSAWARTVFVGLLLLLALTLHAVCSVLIQPNENGLARQRAA